MTVFLLVLVVLAITDEKRESKVNCRSWTTLQTWDIGVKYTLSEWLQLDPSLAVGLTVAVCHLFAIPYTGCGLNPARSLGPAVASLTFDDDHFVYWAGPIVGAVLAASVYHIMYFRSVVPFPKTFDHL